MKLSEVTSAKIKAFCGVSDDEDGMLEICAGAAKYNEAKSYIKEYTGLDDAKIDEYEDITVAYLVLINDMYSSRDFSSDRASQNPVTAQILALHSINLLNGVNENDI